MASKRIAALGLAVMMCLIGCGSKEETATQEGPAPADNPSIGKSVGAGGGPGGGPMEPGGKGGKPVPPPNKGAR